MRGEWLPPVPDWQLYKIAIWTCYNVLYVTIADIISKWTASIMYILCAVCHGIWDFTTIWRSVICSQRLFNYYWAVITLLYGYYVKTKPSNEINTSCDSFRCKANKKPSCRWDSRPYCFTAPLGVTWRHRSRDQLISRMPFPIGWSFGTKSVLYLYRFPIYSTSHVTQWLTWPRYDL